MAQGNAIPFISIVVGVICAAAGSAPCAEVAFRDDFNDPQLAAGWILIREDSATYSLTARPGFFRVLTVRGILGKEGTARNLLVRPMSGDFILDTRLVFNPRDGQPFGGLLVYQDDANAVSIGLVYASGERGEFRGIIMLNVGDSVEPGASPPAARFDETNASDPTSVYLRLLRQGDQFVGAYSEDGIVFHDLGTVTNPLIDEVQVGLGAANGDSPSCGPACDVSIPADFDFLQVSTLNANDGGPAEEITLNSINVSGPGDVSSGASANYSALAQFSGGSSEDVTNDAEWVVVPPGSGTIEAGVFSAATLAATRTATIVATYTQARSTGPVTRSGATVVRIVTESSQSPLPGVCGAGVATFLPLMCIPLVGWSNRRNRIRLGGMRSEIATPDGRQNSEYVG